MGHHIDDIKSTVISGRRKEIEDLVKIALEGDLDPNDIINDALIPAMDVVGQKFANSEIYMPEMLVSAKTMQMALETIKPHLKDAEAQSKGTILMGTVKGDLHDIGKNLVIMMLEGAGFQVIDLGVDLDVEKAVQQVEEVKLQILGLSTLLTTTLPQMKTVIEALQAKGLRDSVKVIVGGAPVNKEFSREIGADGYGKDAVEAVQLSRSLVTAK